ncbi:hypothetical protein OUZ56_024066 [Daphnia magna]|uniref:BEN domain-containing protein n=1 Tax=Daphnia magna TaxID=35525 RepID=A0ABR0B012_9CRUS|nr:hypothetical protein OUZ56_024066 [Daphnia magna]
MPRANKLPKYALFDFNDGSVETGTSSLIDVECDGDGSQTEISHDFIQLKHYRDQLADEILPVASFGKIRERIWEKTDKPDEKINGQIQIALEFTNVRTWIDQLIAKQKANKQLSSSSESSSDVIATVSKIDEPPRNCSEADKLESKGPLFIEAQFPITEKVIDSIPSKNKKSDKRFVAALLRLMYPEEYFATHTMAANLTGKSSMDEKELTQIIDQTLIYFNYIKLSKNEKDEKISIIRKAITTTLNNIKQKNRKK